MGDLTLTDRVFLLEDQVKTLTATLRERLASVVLVEKRKPGCRPRAEGSVSRKKKKVARKGPQVRRGFVKDKVVKNLQIPKAVRVTGLSGVDQI